MAGPDGSGWEPESRNEPRSRPVILLGRLIMILTLVSFLYVGLIVNLLQLVLLMTARLSSSPKWRQLHKKLNGNLLYLILVQPTFILYAWSRMHLEIVLDDVQLMEDVRGPIMAILLPNHSFEIDWTACFVMADQLGEIGNYKCFAKDELKYLPILGWALWMSDLIYVKRTWSEDRKNLDRNLDELLRYEQILLGIFAEGARWTAERYEDSVEFARSRGLEPFKHHLIPRSRGFNHTLCHYLRHEALADGAKPVRVFNLEIVMRNNPKFKDFLEGRQLVADVYCEEVHLSQELRGQVKLSEDAESWPALAQLLQDVFRRKDQIVDEYRANGNRFVPSSPKAGHFPFRRPLRPLVYWSLLMAFTYGSFALLAATLFADSMAFWSLVALFVSGGLLMLRRVESESIPKSARRANGSNLSSGSSKAIWGVDKVAKGAE